VSYYAGLNQRRTSLGLVASICVLALGALLVLKSNVPGELSQPPSSNDQLFEQCITRTATFIKAAAPDFDSYQRIWQLCGNQVYNQLVLDDFTIRREKLIKQELDERVNLWMVVFITVSGVILSGIQLLTSYNLAIAGRAGADRDSELMIEHGKISLKSSITGILILGLSLAFFMIYVLWIYSAREITIERPANLEPATPMVAGRFGGLGPPPADQNQSPPLTNQRPIGPTPSALSGAALPGTSPIGPTLLPQAR
jgi:hypothetical protein